MTNMKDEGACVRLKDVLNLTRHRGDSQRDADGEFDLGPLERRQGGDNDLTLVHVQ